MKGEFKCQNTKLTINPLKKLINNLYSKQGYSIVHNN